MQYLQNGILLFIPVFIFNAVLFRRLPNFYQPALWDQIPKPLDVAENIFRYAVFLLPIFLKVDLVPPAGWIGLGLYIGGVLVYFGSWLIQMVYRERRFVQRLAFRAAPAYTTIFWLMGVSLLCPVSFIPWINVPLIYRICVWIFVVIHTLHACLVYTKNNNYN